MPTQSQAEAQTKQKSQESGPNSLSQLEDTSRATYRSFGESFSLARCWTILRSL
jgi:hypothetical protein